VITLGVLQVRLDYNADPNEPVCGVRCRLTLANRASCLLLCEKLVIFFPALRRIVLAEVEIPAVDPDDAEVLGLEVAVLLLPDMGGTGHGRGLRSESSTWYYRFQTSEPHCPTRAGILTPGFGKT